ncbi:OLC1v1001016C1 [Oldenlandia corymbosa var. corymbosa]|uniref:OLC1v1001016C1 n=1 Tax=Oldenlandia corymbosa var. corymbosa TaxID=529605 RepID=A0AAV1D7C5_OLDCO|nr:OLC1v1001016C1 [Oldenlandia corymbosa var. corymbosa]
MVDNTSGYPDTSSDYYSHFYDQHGVNWQSGGVANWYNVSTEQNSSSLGALAAIGSQACGCHSMLVDGCNMIEPSIQHQLVLHVQYQNSEVKSLSIGNIVDDNLQQKHFDPMGKPCEPVLCEVVPVEVNCRKSCGSLSSDNDIEEIICESYDGSQLDTSVAKGLDDDESKCKEEQCRLLVPDVDMAVTGELTVSLDDEVPKKDVDDQPHECSDDATHDRQCDTSANKLNEVTESVAGTAISDDNQADTYAWLNYGDAVEWRFDLANDLMRPTRIIAFEAYITGDKSSNALVRNSNDVTIQHEADHERKSAIEVSLVDAKVDNTQESVVADDVCKDTEPMFL